MRLRDRIARFMVGRYGIDSFSKFLLIVILVLFCLSAFFGKGTMVSSFVYLLSVAGLVYSYYRMLSKNLVKRRAENEWYLRKKTVVMRWFRSLKDRWTQRKDYRFFRCPSCHALLRVPKGKGKLLLTCRKCGRRFERRT